MSPARLAALWVVLLGATLPLELIGQDSAQTNLQSNSVHVPSAVVQLLAVGPGAHGHNQDCAATGFLINEDGYILTNAHVIEKSKECLAQSPGAKLLAKFANGESAGRSSAGNADASHPTEMTAPAVACEVVGVDEAHDLGVVKAERPPSMVVAGQAIPFVLLRPAPASIGAAIQVTGHPVSAWDAITQSGKIIARKDLAIFERSDEPSEMIVLNISLKHGSSGSPVYLEAGGAVVGVVERQNTSDTSQTLAVPIRYACELLDRLGVRWHAAAN